MSASKILVLLLFVLAGCGKDPHGKEVFDLAQGANLPGLVHAGNAPVFDVPGKPYTEIVLIDGAWKVHDAGNWHVGGGEDEVYEVLHDIRDNYQYRGIEMRILISAAGDVAFKEIQEVVRSAARAGINRVAFLVGTGSAGSRNHAFHLDLPCACVRPLSDIDPFMISLDSKGSVFTGSGVGRAMLDSAPEDHSLPKLNSQLELYAAAARAAKCSPWLQVHADPAVNYQRVIDLFSHLYAHRITDIYFTDLNFSLDTSGEGMNKCRIERLELLEIKPIPPRPPSSYRNPPSVD